MKRLLFLHWKIKVFSFSVNFYSLIFLKQIFPLLERKKYQKNFWKVSRNILRFSFQIKLRALIKKTYYLFDIYSLIKKGFNLSILNIFILLQYLELFSKKKDPLSQVKKLQYSQSPLTFLFTFSISFKILEMKGSYSVKIPLKGGHPYTSRETLNHHSCRNLPSRRINWPSEDTRTHLSSFTLS